MLLSLVAMGLVMSSSSPAERAFAQMQTLFLAEDQSRYYETWKAENRSTDTAFNWSMGVMLTAHVSMAKLDDRHRAALDRALALNEKYWNPAAPVAGFDVLPGPPFPNDRYYDDNAWIAMAYTDAYEVTLNPKWLDRAEETLKYVLSGEDDKLGGGVYWREKDKPSKNTCSNGPTAAAALALYEHRPKPEFLDAAKRLYAWTQKHLQDPSDKLFWDNLNLEGKMDKFKWSYNTGLMLRSAKQLARFTKDPKYAEDAKEIEASARKKWFKADGTVDCELQFSHLLFENFDLKSADLDRAEKALLATAVDGRFPKRKNAPELKEGRFFLIHQASATRMLAIIALARKER